MNPKSLIPKLSRWVAISIITLAFPALLLATPQAPPSGDVEIAEYIGMDIDQDQRLEGARIGVELNDGIATLSGTVESLAQAERASSRAVANAGVRAVVNRLQVNPKNDSEILKEARRMIDGQNMIVAEQVSISVSDHRMLLEGTVGTWDEKDLARDVISEVLGIVAIENALTVSGRGQREDSQIAEQIRFLIHKDPVFDGLDVAVMVKSGSVQLRGQVGSSGEIGRLMRRCHVDGVTGFRTSGLKVNGDLAMEGLVDKVYSRTESLAALRDALRADDRIYSKGLNTSMEDGVLTLTGNVGQVAESDAVESTARVIPGIVRVVNDLRITGEDDRGGKLPDIKVASSPWVMPPL